ncbi:MAG: MarR family winged helix-turn-helix transcriptional regulator [Acidimicrobiales bacterium]
MTTSSKADEGYVLVRLVHEVVEGQRRAFADVAGAYGLTAPQARTVLRLFEATPMRYLADHLSCDASNVTGIADRLRARGLVKTRTGTDRRVRLLELTVKGQRLRASIQQRLTEETPTMTRLNASERRELVALLEKLAGADHAS